MENTTTFQITLNDIEKYIVSEHYFTARNGLDGAIAAGTYEGRTNPDLCDADLSPLNLLTFCVLVLRNGFTVVGKSACVDPRNFDAQIGFKVARKNAIEEMWPLMGYALKDQIYKSST